MLYLYESTKFISLRPLANCILVLCSSIAWKEPSWVIVPSLSVSRHGWGDAFACMLAAHDLSSEKELLDLVFSESGVVGGTGNARANEASHCSENELPPIEIMCMHRTLRDGAPKIYAQCEPFGNPATMAKA